MLSCLEHVSFPLKIIADIKKLMRNESILYLEVPMEYPFSSKNNLTSFLNPIIFNLHEAFKKRKALLNQNSTSFSASKPTPNLIKGMLLLVPLCIKRLSIIDKFLMK